MKHDMKPDRSGCDRANDRGRELIVELCRQTPPAMVLFHAGMRTVSPHAVSYFAQ
ncbi:hypothetical protein C8N35_105121 [Breoghania corrubedonensis]|uniref:Uncharacterized protein n=1 Tax=Breoghania corrubedonensis TaxID=665038 RepID=A0A2T5V8M5_9HYPH|nr:hypothetical protein [Breoghania corrubedonensis]PTW60119.1 hypothetical protein C8N35_105121 [Breoghania corrubedonensis]